MLRAVNIFGKKLNLRVTPDVRNRVTNLSTINHQPSTNIMVYGGQNREKYTAGEYATYIGATLALVAGIVLYVGEIRYFDSYIEVGKMLSIAFAAGLAAGILLGYALRGKAESLTEKVQIYIFGIVVCMIFAPLPVSLVNRHLDFSAPREEVVQIVNVEPQFASAGGLLEGEKATPNQVRVEFLHKNERYDFTSKNLRFVGMERGQETSLTFREGLFGFEYFERE